MNAFIRSLRPVRRPTQGRTTPIGRMSTNPDMQDTIVMSPEHLAAALVDSIPAPYRPRHARP